VQIICAADTVLTLKDVNINNSDDAPVDIKNPDEAVDAVTLILEGTNKLTAGDGYAAVQVESSTKLTISEDSTGSLTAQGGYGGAGIGGAQYDDNVDVTIAGGTIIATGGDYGAGIGGGDYGSMFNITITGGDVTAQGGTEGAGIGGGYEAEGGTITINGGTVDATGGDEGAGIGYGIEGGYDNSDDDLVINIGGTADVTAQGGYEGAGIGYGDAAEDGKIIVNISGGRVVARGGEDGAGIGSGYESEDDGEVDSEINISGGWVYATGHDDATGLGAGDDADWGTIRLSGGVVNAYGVDGDDIGEGDNSIYDNVYLSGSAYIFCLYNGMYDDADLGTHRHVEIDIFDDGNPVPAYTLVDFYNADGFLGEAIVHDDGGYFDAYLPDGDYWFEKDGKKTATFMVAGSDLDIRRDLASANLSGLETSDGTLTPAFDAGTTVYAADVAHDVETITVTPTAQDADDTITVDRSAVASGSASDPITLGTGLNVIAVVVTDGTVADVQNIYTLKVTRGEKPVSDRTVSIDGFFTDGDGDPRAGDTLELRSEPQTVVTDSGGRFLFENVTVGEHTLTVSDPDGATLGTFALDIGEGSAFSWSDDGSNNIEVTLSGGTVRLVFRMSIDDGTVTVDDIENRENPATGAGSLLWVGLAALAAVAAAGFVFYRRKVRA